MEPVRRVLLVGFMAAGKSRVGERLAEQLEWDFADFDGLLEKREGRTIAEIFAAEGEAYFREAEAAIATELLARDEVVLAAGGGWAATPGRLESVPGGTATVWLKVSATVALERSRAAPGRRPLLEVPDPLARASELLAEREAAYAAAKWTVDTEGRTVDDVSARIREILASGYPDTST